MNRKRILVVDDHSIVRHGIATLLNSEADLIVCGEAGSYEQALELLPQTNPDVMLVDITLKDRNGLDLIREIRAAGNPVKVLVLSIHDESVYAERALQAGAQGYVMKEKGDDDIVKAIREVADGKTYVSPEISERILRQKIGGMPEAARATGVSGLTDRELEIFECIGRGLDTRAIADKFALSARTVEVHRAHIKKKLGCQTAADVVREAVRWVERG
ncbi:MAG: response regulator [Kiritimatiellia bacterium]